MNYLSLCSGVGGMDLAMQSIGGRCVAYVEIYVNISAVAE